MSGKPTPGPWEVREVNESSCGRPCTPDGCHESHPSGVWEILGPQWDEEIPDTIAVQHEPDAHLIAAAPELLEALEAALRIRDLWGSPGPGMVGTAAQAGEWAALSSMEERFRTAIAKARGES